MAIKIEKYTGLKTYMTPAGTLATPQSIAMQYPAMIQFQPDGEFVLPLPHIVETDERGEVMYAIENLSAARSRYGIDPELSEEDAIAAIEEIRNTPPPDPGPSAEERIAAAMEFQNLMSL